MRTCGPDQANNRSFNHLYERTESGKRGEEAKRENRPSSPADGRAIPEATSADNASDDVTMRVGNGRIVFRSRRKR